MTIDEDEIEKALVRFRAAARWIVRMHELGIPIEESDWTDLAKGLSDYDAAVEGDCSNG